MKTQVTLVASLLATGLAPNPVSANDGAVSSVCGTAAGTRFNLEPRIDATRQSDPSVDFLRNQVGTSVDLVVGVALGNSGAHYEVNRDADCAPEFEGVLPKFPGPFEGAEPLGPIGGPAIARTDAGRGAAFLAGAYDNRSDGSGVGVLRATAANLLNPTACPAGRHTNAQAVTCWPKRVLVSPSWAFNTDIVNLAVDQRTSGIGAGNVYLVFRQMTEGLWIHQLFLVSCKNDLSVCSAPLQISSDDGIQVPELSVRPDGRPSVTYVLSKMQSETPFKRWSDIKYLSCTPPTPPSAPTCMPPRLVHSEKQAVFGAIGGVDVSTRPKHDHRVDANGTETYLTWERCKGPVPWNAACPDVDVVMKASRDDGATWSAVACVDCGAQNQFLPAIRVDRARSIVNIAYYSSEVDTIFQKRVQVKLAHVDPGAVTPDPVTNTHLITTVATDPQAESSCLTCFTGSIGVAARSDGTDGSGRAYIHFNFNTAQGIYKGIKVPDANNHLGRVDY